MEAYQYPIQHFRFMAEIAVRLASMSAQILEHSYMYEAFGSWWFTFKKSDSTYRVVFDGRDYYLALEAAVASSEQNRIASWKQITGKPLTAQTAPESLLSETCAMIEESS